MSNSLEEIKNDFKLFLYLIWDHINLPDPTPLQYDIAHYLQHGPNKICIQAFRGVGKSFITSAYVLWELLKDPQKKILVVSASKVRADNFADFTLKLINEVPILAHLKPREDQRASRIQFDVGPAIPDQSPSVRSVGITSQIAGSRADIIVADDVEVPNNSATIDLREKLIERTKEFSAVLKPLPTSKIIYLGTPQTEDSSYNKLADTFETKIWSARIPDAKLLEVYGSRLTPFMKRLIAKGRPGDPTDPKRFSDADLAEREAEYGKAGFALQFMLNTQLSDQERFPLKVRDLVFIDIKHDKMPMRVDWLPDPDREMKHVPNMAMAGDRFYTYRAISEPFSEFQGSVLAIDPAGRGKDEMGYAVVKMLNGYLYVPKAGGLPGGYEYANLKALADICKEHSVNKVVIEANFGDGMFTELIKPVLAEVHPCQVEEVKHSIQKERRIIDTLEPVMNRHKLVFDPKVITEDYDTSLKRYDTDAVGTAKSLIYQMTRISYDKGSLRFDDRLDALAIGVAYWVQRIAIDDKVGMETKKQELLDKELRGFMERATSNKSYNNKPKWFSIKGR